MLVFNSFATDNTLPCGLEFEHVQHITMHVVQRKYEKVLTVCKVLHYLNLCNALSVRNVFSSTVFYSRYMTHL